MIAVLTDPARRGDEEQPVRPHDAASIDMPTLMKKSPSSMPRNGSISASSWWRKFDSARSTPARNAPIAIESPTFSMRSAEPSTTRSAEAVITSRAPLSARIWKNGLRP